MDTAGLTTISPITATAGQQSRQVILADKASKELIEIADALGSTLDPSTIQLLNQDLTANGGRNVILGRLLTSIDLLNHLASEVKHILKEAHSPDKSIKSRIPLMEIAVQFSAEAREHNKDIGKITEQFGPAQPRRPMNAPPQMAVQINVPGQSPQVHIK